MIRGSCLCGKVRYEVRGPLAPAINCHCSMCRKAHGAAFGTYARLATKDFTLTAGADCVASHSSSSDVTRTFCRHCGSSLQFIRATRPDSFSLALGTLDDDPGVRPSMHMFTASKASWYDITDDLPQHAARPARP